MNPSRAVDPKENDFSQNVRVVHILFPSVYSVVSVMTPLHGGIEPDLLLDV